MYVDWDPDKAKSNLAKHGVSFEEASYALDDTLGATSIDPDHSVGEMRYITFGMSNMGRLLVVSHTDDGVYVRIISARTVTKHERLMYEQY